MKKLSFYAVILIILFSYLSLYSFQFEKINSFTLKDIKTWHSPIIRIENAFYAINYSSRKIIKFDNNGKILKIVGGKGKGPGEFEGPYRISNNKDTLYVSDYSLYRISKFDKNLNFLESFYIKGGYQDFICTFKDKLISIGNNCKYMFDQKRDYHLGLIYKRKNGSYAFEKRIIKIEKFPKIFPKLNSSSFKSFIGYTSIRAISLNNNIYIAFNHIPYIIKYNVLDETIKKIYINFPDYIDPFKINYKKGEKLFKKFCNCFFDPNVLQYSPIFFAYDKNSRNFIIQYARPYNSILKFEKSKPFITVIFNYDFKYLHHFYSDENYKCLYYKNNKIYILASKSYRLFLDIPNNFDTDNTKFIIYKINE